jgi:hypothetical protein
MKSAEPHRACATLGGSGGRQRLLYYDPVFPSGKPTLDGILITDVRLAHECVAD